MSEGFRFQKKEIWKEWSQIWGYCDRSEAIEAVKCTAWADSEKKAKSIEIIVFT